MGGIYKIVAKVLANRLKMVVEKIFCKHQTAFIRGWQILDFALIANECFDSRIRFGESSMLCNLDIEKAMIMLTRNFCRIS